MTQVLLHDTRSVESLLALQMLEVFADEPEIQMISGGSCLTHSCGPVPDISMP